MTRIDPGYMRCTARLRDGQCVLPRGHRTDHLACGVVWWPISKAHRKKKRRKKIARRKEQEPENFSISPSIAFMKMAIDDVVALRPSSDLPTGALFW